MNNPTKDEVIIILALERARLIALKKPTRKDMRLAFALDSAIKVVTVFRKFAESHGAAGVSHADIARAAIAAQRKEGE